MGGNQVDVSLGPWPPGLVRSPLGRAIVTRLKIQLHWNSPRQDQRLLRMFTDSLTFHEESTGRRKPKPRHKAPW